jgi:hypothetical protein
MFACKSSQTMVFVVFRLFCSVLTFVCSVTVNDSVTTVECALSLYRAEKLQRDEDDETRHWMPATFSFGGIGNKTTSVRVRVDSNRTMWVFSEKAQQYICARHWAWIANQLGSATKTEQSGSTTPPNRGVVQPLASGWMAFKPAPNAKPAPSSTPAPTGEVSSQSTSSRPVEQSASSTKRARTAAKAQPASAQSAPSPALELAASDEREQLSKPQASASALLAGSDKDLQ